MSVLIAILLLTGEPDDALDALVRTRAQIREGLAEAGRLSQ